MPRYKTILDEKDLAILNFINKQEYSNKYKLSKNLKIDYLSLGLRLNKLENYNLITRKKAVVGGRATNRLYITKMGLEILKIFKQ